MNNAYLPTNVIQLIGWSIMIFSTIGGGTFVSTQFIRWYIDLRWKIKDAENQAKATLAKVEAEKEIKLAEAKVELAKHNTLSATQVADVIKYYHDVIGELEKMKERQEYKNKEMIDAINRLERLAEKNIETFTEFLSNNFKKP